MFGNPLHHGVVDTVQALEPHPWTAYPEALGIASPGIVDPGAALWLVHPDAAVARSVLRGAMAARAAEWRTRRAGVDVCDEPACRGGADGCLLVHAGRRRRAAAVVPAEPAPSAPLPAGAGISRAHHERRERRSRLLAVGWSVDDVLSWSSQRA